MEKQHLIEQRMLMLSNPHFGPLLGMTASTVSDWFLTHDEGDYVVGLYSKQWCRFVADQLANRNEPELWEYW